MRLSSGPVDGRQNQQRGVRCEGRARSRRRRAAALRRTAGNFSEATTFHPSCSGRLPGSVRDFRGGRGRLRCSRPRLAGRLGLRRFRSDGGLRGDGRFNGDDQRGDTINGSFGAANSVTNNGRFWQVGSTTSFGANTNFEGTGLSGNSFSVRAGTTINDGRILTGTGQTITLAGNSINFKGRTRVQRRSGVARRREFERGDSEAFALCVEDGRGGTRGDGVPPPFAACGPPPVNDGAAPMLRQRAGDADGRYWRRRRRNLADRCAQ